MEKSETMIILEKVSKSEMYYLGKVIGEGI